MKVRPEFLVLAAAAAVGGCGGGTPLRPHADPTPRATAAAPPAARTILTFRRVRYAGATLRVLEVHADGSIAEHVPSGGAGRAEFEGRLEPRTFRRVRRLVRTIPWRHLSSRKAVYDGSGAYFMLRHAGAEHVAMASGMSRDLVPLVTVLNRVLNREGGAHQKTVQRYFTPS